MRNTFLSSLVLAILAAAATVSADCSTSLSPQWKETSGNQGFPYVDSAIEITSQDTDSVTFSVAQSWIDPGTPMFAVHYRSASEEEEVCEMAAFDDGRVVAYESSKSYTAQCSHGYAEIGIYLYVGADDSFVAAECEACTAPDDSYVGHYVTVPCVYDPECEPSSAPSAPPTEDIDRTPDPPVNCVDSAKALLKETVGNDAAFPNYQPPLTITAQDLDSVKLTVEQLFNENGVGMMAVGYRNTETDTLTCEMEQPQVVFGYSTDIEAKCEMGYAEVSIYLYTEANFDVTDCEACTVPNDTEYVAYHYIVPCTPICKPDVPDCFSGPLVQLADIGDEHDICIYDEMPIMLEQSGMTSGAVEFTLSNTWPAGDVTSVSVSYVDARTEQATCGTYGSEEVPFDSVSDLKAKCDGEGMSTIVINVHGSGIQYQSDKISTNTCELPTSGGTCGYEVVLPCDPMMVCGVTSKPSNSPTESPTTFAPTLFPTHPPSFITAEPTVSNAPTGCFEQPDPILIDNVCKTTSGADMTNPLAFPPGAVTVTATAEDAIAFTISQTFYNDVAGLAVRTGLDDCTVTDNVAYGANLEFEGECVDGVAAINMVVFLDPQFVATDCQACNVQDLTAMGGDDEFCAYRVEIPCETVPIDCGEPSAAPSGSFYPSSVPSETPSISSPPTSSPTGSPSAGPTDSPSAGPTDSPSSGPSDSPTKAPTTTPTSSPSASPSSGPTASPSAGPTDSPSAGPTASPSSGPTASPSASPSDGPTASPSAGPTDSPSSGPTPSPSTDPTASPTVSMAPTDCMGSVPPKVTSSICMDGDKPMETMIGLPEGAVVVLDEQGTSVDVLVTQLWGDDAIALAIKHEDVNLASTCDIHEVDCEERFNLAAQCIEGYTSVTIVVYMGTTFVEEECKACDVEDVSLSGGTFCAYNIEIACEPMSVECGEPSASPSGSFYPSSMPSESPTISSPPTSSPTSSPSASPSDGPTASPSAGPTASPSAGPTDSPSSGPTASPSSGPTASPSSGPTASPSASPSSGPTASPSAGPTASPSSGPTASPSAGPTASPSSGPTASPSASPSAGPTANPSAGPTASPSAGPTASPSSGPTPSPSSDPTASPTVSMAPTDCMGSVPPKVVSEICMDGDLPMDKIGLPEGAVVVLDEKGTSVDVLVTQKWGDDAIALAIRHDDVNLASTCDIHEVDCEERFNLAAQCIQGYTSVTIVVYMGTTFVEEECKACDVDDVSLSGGKFCAYNIEIACEPMSVECGEPSASPSGSFYPSSMPSESPTISSPPTSSPTSSPSASPSDGPTASPSAGPTASPSSGPTASPSAGPTDSPSSGPTASPSASPSSGPTASPSSGPTDSPSAGPTDSPSAGPTASPSSGPTSSPSAGPTASPSDSPTKEPTTSPSASPSGSFYPSSQPSEAPTKSAAPSAGPTASPSAGPTDSPTYSPSAGPTDSPSAGPTASPSSGPTPSPSAGPTDSPSSGPTDSPSASPSSGPTASPSSGPTDSPSAGPTDSPSAGPTASPSSGPTASPSAGPTDSPSSGPTDSPSSGPTASPSASPSDTPTLSPTVSMAPTDCMGSVPPKVVSEICMDGDKEMDMIALPEGAIVVKNEHGVSVDVTVTQLWGDDAIALAIKHEDLEFESTCDIHEVDCEERFNLSAECVEGMTSITIVVYMGTTFEESECKACDVDDISLSGGKFCAYNIEVACEPMSVECGEPSASPSGSFYPSSMPSESPTISSPPTSSPTSSPSASPSDGPTASPSAGPTTSPSSGPTDSPSAGPTASPSSGPTASPSASPSDGPTASPSAGPTDSPSSGPTDSPSAGPTSSPSAGPTASPSSGPTASPSAGPTASPSAGPTDSPSAGPTENPTKSMSPTHCTEYMPPKVIDSVCMTTGGEKMETTPLPDGALTIGDVLDGKVGFTVIQNWVDEAGIAIQAGTDSCVVEGNVTLGDSEDMSATCMAGYAGITVVVFMDDEFDPNDCKACNVDDLSEMGGDYEFCAYRIEIPCEPVEVECGEPSASPSGSFYPSSEPTESPSVSMAPTDSPTSSPSASPSDAPTTSPSASPTDSPSSSPTSGPSSPPTEEVDPVPPEPVCPEREAILIANEGETMYPDIPITITMQNGTHVGFNVENTFGQTVSSIFTQYHSGSFGETECIEEENVEQDMPIEFIAQCMRNTKISITNIWITDCNETERAFLDELLDNAEVPECCHPGDECKTVQYTFKIPCVDPCPPDGATEAPVETRKLHEVDAHDLIRKKKAHDGSAKEFEDLTGHPEPNNAEDHFCVVEDYPCGPGLDKVHVCHYSARDGYKTFCVPEADSDALRFYPKDYCGPCVGGYAVA